MKRRNFITLVGGGTILAAGVGFVTTRTPHTALRPWHEAGSSYKDPRKKALSYAILAPNPHNRQPWLADLSQPDQLILSVDTGRLLPHTDPFNRQITIGLGCFLELLQMAAAQDGYRIDLSLFPQGENDSALDNRPIAIATFVKDSAVVRDPLFAHVLARRTLKEPYDIDRNVPSKSLRQLEAAVAHKTRIGSNNESKLIDGLRNLTREAMMIEIETPHTYQESVDLFRIGKAEIQANPDGIDFSGPLFETMYLAGLFSREKAKDVTSSAYKEGIAAVIKPIDTAMGYVWLVTDDNSRVSQINAGRDWLRVNLAATSEGLGIHPMSQALQEYPEMKTHYTKVHAMLAPQNGTVQMLARLGYGEAVAQSPRWPVEHVITASKTSTG